MEEPENTTERILVRSGDHHFNIVLDVVQVHTSANIYEYDESPEEDTDPRKRSRE